MFVFFKESKGFIYAFENLKLNTGTEQEIDKSTFLTTKHVETLPSNMNFEVNAPIFGFHIHEKSLSQPIIRGPDIPNHQVYIQDFLMVDIFIFNRNKSIRLSN